MALGAGLFIAAPNARMSILAVGSPMRPYTLTQTDQINSKSTLQTGRAIRFYRSDRWPGLWYALSQLPDEIDLLVIDGPPWSVHPFARGIADCLFDRISPGGIIMLDDAARPGERLIARRRRSEWPEFSFNFEGEGSKGLLIGRKSFERV